MYFSLAQTALRAESSVGATTLGVSTDRAAVTALSESVWWALRALDSDTPIILSRAFDHHKSHFSSERMRVELTRSARAVLIESVDRPAPGEPVAEFEVRHEDLVCITEFVSKLLCDLTERSAGPKTIWLRRLGRCAALLAVTILVAMVVPAVLRSFRTDLAPRAAWRTSTSESGYASSGRGFHPHEGGPNVFFQTRIEPAPWIEFDLGAPHLVESVGVQNRLDCCQDWAVPLTVELSDDGRRWREVGRRTEPFYFYTVLFPRTATRYVRLRVSRATSLQLGKVQIR